MSGEDFGLRGMLMIATGRMKAQKSCAFVRQATSHSDIDVEMTIEPGLLPPNAEGAPAADIDGRLVHVSPAGVGSARQR